MKNYAKLMKSIIATTIAVILLIPLCSCDGGTRTPQDRLPDEVKNYVSQNFRIEIGTYVSEPVNVDVASIREKQTNEWIVLGTYTVKIGTEIKSAKFGLVASYNESTEKFSFSQESFDEFK